MVREGQDEKRQKVGTKRHLSRDEKGDRLEVMRKVCTGFLKVVEELKSE